MENNNKTGSHDIIKIRNEVINYLNMKGHSISCHIESDKNFWWVKIK